MSAESDDLARFIHANLKRMGVELKEGEQYELAYAILRREPPAPSPYRFTVSVEKWPHHDRWELRIIGPAFDAGPWWGESYFMSEAEARSHAAQVLAALHQATMEET